MALPVFVGIAIKVVASVTGTAVVAKVAHSKGYNSGYSDGSTSGYNRASKVYEEKFRKQADKFLSDKNKWFEERREYEKLLDDYECEIQRLERELASIYSDEGAALLRKMKNRYSQLKRLAS